MRWKHSRMISWMLIVAMSYSPSMIYAQQSPSSGDAVATEKAKIDLGLITPKTALAVVAYPRYVLTAPGMEMLPTEVIEAWGKKFLGINPLEVEQIVAIAEPSQAGPPQAAIVLRMSKPLGDEKVLPQLWDSTTESQLDGKAYRKGINPMLPSIFRADETTLIVASDDLLRELLSNRTKPQEGQMSRILGRVSSPPDAMAILLVEPLRPLIALPLSMAQVPPPLADVKKVPELLASVGVKVNLTGDMAMSLTLKANDETSADQLVEIIDKLLEVARQTTAAQNARNSTSSDPMEQAAAQYAKRMSDRMLQTIRPVRKGQILTLANNTNGQNPQQMMQTATIGILVALLLPAVQSARQAARRVQSTNEMRQICLAMHNYASANKRLPPAYKADANGMPLLSWRVLILPYLEENELYKQFHLNEPWDSKHNKQLIAKMPAVYRNPNSKVAAQGKTNYLTVRNERSIFFGEKGCSFAWVRDGLSNTIMTVEVPDASAVIWTKPDDFMYDESNPLKGLVGEGAKGFSAGFGDGSVRFIASPIDPATLKALFTRDGREAVVPPQ